MLRRGHMAARQSREWQYDFGWFVLQGAVGGFIAGIIITAAVLLWAAANGMSLMEPARDIASPFVGSGADTGTIVAVAILAAVLYSLAAGAVIGTILTPVAALGPGFALIGGTLLGVALWLLHRFVLAPGFGLDWFSDMNPGLQVFLFALFGFIVGTYLASTAPRAAVVADVGETHTHDTPTYRREPGPEPHSHVSEPHTHGPDDEGRRHEH